ncbi:dihydrofolate reductase family protein [Ferrimonas sp. YFM]|uniref:dihydrofolate reductase family protein n=1 Tax=Ferrimonas sp. YFM TaxID=3028878 RepID=UPI002572BB8A|nr:dihydrofolate reductase family protein [Ferrimonas sp. YFM]BDY03708.1 diacylglycerol kinase [Ferrimonas sp. YFM]
MSNIVFIGTSLDNYIADKQGGLEWLTTLPNPEQDDCGFGAFMASVDALVMGRNTFDTVCGFEGEWPYSKPVFVLSRTLSTLPETLKGKAELIQGLPAEVTRQLNDRGFQRLYIDGGQTIQSFLEADLIDEMIISQLPVLLGGGTPLFGDLATPLWFQHLSSEVMLGAITKHHYRRRRD